jgi:hypothetical protein
VNNDRPTSAPEQQLPKKPYSTPQLTDVGAIEQLVLAGSPPVGNGRHLLKRMKKH